MTTRDAILEAIRAANGGPTKLAEAMEAWPNLAREYVVSRDRCGSAELFEERLCDYDAVVKHCCAETLAESVLNAMQVLGIRRLAVPDGLTSVASQRLARSGTQLIVGNNTPAAELDHVDAVLTEAVLGIAETGSIVLQNVPGQGPRALSLVPDVHLCVVRKASIVDTVPEAIRVLEMTASLPTTFISGPSATADIEMTRIKGVHGPRFLHVFLVG